MANKFGVLEAGQGLADRPVRFIKRSHALSMESRVALTRSLAKFAWKLSTKGGPKVINELQRTFQSSLKTSGTSGVDRNHN